MTPCPYFLVCALNMLLLILPGTISDPAGKHATEILKKLQAESDLFVAKQKEIAVNKIRYIFSIHFITE